MKHNKRAFTIVELVIVIAILAILAAVLIPTFVNLTKKANESNTMQLVKNMNTALKADMPDGKHPTMQSALDAANAFGYDLEKINKSKTDNEILWDSENDCFVYMKDGEAQYVPDSNLTVSKEKMKTQPYMYWKIVSDQSELNAALGGDYSVYLGYEYEAADPITIAKKGIDVGANKNIDVTFADENTTYTVAIRTNGGALRVNAPKATVYHYDKADMVVIEAVAGKSYHEFGDILGTIQVKSGNVVVENNGAANNVVLTGADAKVTIESNAKVDEVLAAKTEYYDNVTKKNAETKMDKNVTMTPTEGSSFAGGNGTRDFPYLIASETQLRELANCKSEAYVKLIADVEVTFKKFDPARQSLFPEIDLNTDIHLDMNGKKILVSEKSTTAGFGKASPAFFAVKAGTLTIDGNGELSCEAGSNQVYGINIIGTNAKVVVNSGRFFGALTAIQVQKGALEINGGEFDMAPTCKAQVPLYAKYMINVIDASYKNGTATILVKGGTFINFDPSNNPEGAGTTYVATGYKVNSKNDDKNTYYTVVSNETPAD